MRTETALRLTVGDEAQAVPVRVVDAMPAPFASVLTDFERIAWLLLNRPVVEAAARGTAFLVEHHKSARTLLPEPGKMADSEEIVRVQRSAGLLLARLDEIKAVDTIVGTEEDVLGAYFFLVPEIRLYWKVIGIVSAMLDVSVEAMTVVVLAHELAHAYTHLGRDIDEERWDTGAFAATDINIVEGLAQFYTQVICQRLAMRMPSAIKAYDALLARQSAPYKAHLPWTTASERGGEIVRVAMIECRSRRIKVATAFAEAIRRQGEQVKGRARTAKQQEPDHAT